MEKCSGAETYGDMSSENREAVENKFLKTSGSRETEASFGCQSIVLEREKNKETAKEREVFLCYADEFFKKFENFEI